MDPVQQNAGTTPAQQPASASTPAVKTSGLAIAALVLGIIGLLGVIQPIFGLPCAILAVIFGFVAKSKIKKGLAGGRGLAISGIILGFVAILVGIVAIIALVFVLRNTFSNPEFTQKIQQLQQQSQQQMMQASTSMMKK